MLPRTILFVSNFYPGISAPSATHYKDNTWVRVNRTVENLLECSTLYLTSDLHSLVKYMNTRRDVPYSQATITILFYHINILITTFLTTFRRFPRFPKILQKFSEAHTKIFEYFPITEDCRGRSEDVSKMFRSYTNKYNYSLKSSIPSLVRMLKIRYSSPGCGFV